MAEYAVRSVKQARPTRMQNRAEWADLRRLVTAQVVSQFGTSVTAVALPLLAVLQLDASALALGFITGAQFAAYAVLGLLAGVFVDRWSRRRVLLTTDVARAAVMAVVALLAVAGVMRVWHLIVVALLISVLSLFFDTAYPAYLPTLVSRDKLVKGNARLQAGTAVTQLAGPGLGGLLVQSVGAPGALFVDATSYLLSFTSVKRIRRVEEPAVRRSTDRNDRTTIRKQIAEGFAVLRHDRIMLGFMGTIAHFNIMLLAQQALVVPFLVRAVHAPPVLVGSLLAAQGVGAMGGALVAARVAAAIGIGRTMVLGASIGPLFGLLIPFAERDVRLLCFVIGSAALGVTIAILKVVSGSYRQATVPSHLLGRVVASMRVLTWGPTPLGGLLGGVLGQFLGLRPGMLVVAVLTAASPLWLLVTGVWRMPETDSGADR